MASSQALYLKWRPATFEEVVGQEHVTFTLRNALVTGRIAHAYLFTGPRGTGKTTMARVVAKAVSCLAEDPAARPCNECRHCVAVNEGRFLDLIEIDAASHTSVDDVRELRDKIAFAPNEGRYKIYIIDEVHRFSGAAFDALLKTLEEPPAHAIFVLATTEAHKVPQTILSRCQRFDFRRIPIWQIVERLTQMAEAEGLQVEQPALELIARQATGSLRDAISLFDQLLSQPDQVLTLDLAQTILGTATGQTVQDLTAVLISGDTAAGLGLIGGALDAGTDPRQLARQMVDYLRFVMVVQTGSAALVETSVSGDALEMIATQAGQLPRRALLDSIKAFNEAASDTRGGWQPQLPLELAFLNSVEALHGSSAQPPAEAPQPRLSKQAPLPQETATSADSEAELPAPDAPTAAEIQAHWNDVLAAVRQSDPAVYALLNPATKGRLYGIEGYTVIYQMPSETLRAKIEADTNRIAIEKALQQVFGLPLKMRSRVGTGGDTQSREADDLIAGDSLIAYSVNELGGKIKGIKKKTQE